MLNFSIFFAGGQQKNTNFMQKMEVWKKWVKMVKKWAKWVVFLGGVFCENLIGDHFFDKKMVSRSKIEIFDLGELPTPLAVILISTSAFL